MAVTTKKTFNAVGSGGQSSTTVFTPVSIELNNQDDLDVYVTLSGGTRVLQLRQSTGSTTDSNHPQVNDTTGLYFPAQSAGVTLHNYTLSTDNNTITFNSALPSGAVVSIERRTRDSSSDYTNFAGGSTIRHTDINKAFDESNFTAQEARNKAFEIEGKIFGTEATSTAFISSDEIVDGTIVGGDIATDTITASNLAANSVGSSELADDAVDTNAIQDNAVTMDKLNSGVLPTDVTIASANIVDGTIVNADISNSASIAHSKLSGISGGNVLLGNSSNVPTSTTLSGDVTVNSSGVTAITSGVIVTGDIAADQITNALIADNQIDSEHYVDGSIDHVHLANDVIDGDNIQDDVINSEHIAAGAVDEEHMSANSIGSAQYIDGSIDRVHLSADLVDGTKIADDSINSEHYVDASIDAQHLANNSVIESKILNDAVTTNKIANDAVTTAKIPDNAITADKLADNVFVPANAQAGVTSNDVSFFTTSASDARYFNVSTGDTIKDGDTFPDNDTTIATTAAINDRIIDLVDDVGGFVPIANETSFPNANPDVNNGTGTLVSIKALSSNLTSNGSGVATIANGTVGNSTVTINGLANSTTYNAGFGMLVETTTTLNTYTFHRQVPIATEVSTVAGSISNVNTVAGDISNVNAVAGNATNINAVAGNNSNVTAVADNASNINSAVSNASNINSAVSNASNINTTAGSISNVNTVAGSISNVNTVASNMSTVNDFGARYRAATNNAGEYSSDNDAGDLYFNTEINALKVWNGSAWITGVTDTGDYAVTTGNTFTGNNDHNDNVKVRFGTGDDLEIFHDGSHSKVANSTGYLVLKSNQFSLANGDESHAYIKVPTNEQGVELYYDNIKKFETTSAGYKCGDDVKGVFGAGDDLKIYHDGTNTHLENNTGILNLRSTGNIVLSKAYSETLAKFEPDGANELYYDNVKKFETTSGGVDVTGTVTTDGLTCDGASYFNADSIFDGATAGRDMWWDRSNNSLRFYDNALLLLGNDSDLQIYHTGSHSHISDRGGAGNLNIESNNAVTIKQNDAEHYMAKFFQAGAAELYYDNSKKLETTSTGIAVTGRGDFTQASSPALHVGNTDYYFKLGQWATNSSPVIDAIGSSTSLIFGINGSEVGRFSGDDFRLGDSKNLALGASQDLKIFHDGTNSVFKSLSHQAWVETNVGLNIASQAAGEYMAKFIKDGAVELYHNNVKTFETFDDGIIVQSGNNANGNIKLFADRGDEAADMWMLVAAADSSQFRLQNYADGGWENSFKANGAGSVELYYDNTKRFDTNSGGAACHGAFTVHGELGIDNGADNNKYMDVRLGSSTFVLRGTSGGDANHETLAQFTRNGAVELYYDNSKKCYTNSLGLKFDDSDKACFGNASDLQIYHDGSHTFFENTTGDLLIRNSASNEIKIQAVSGEQSIVANANGSVELYNDNVKVFQTHANGARVIGTEGASATFYMLADEGDDNADYWRLLADEGSCNFKLQNQNSGSWETNLRAVGDGATELYYDNVKKLETTSYGSAHTGIMRFENSGDGISLYDSRELKLGSGDDLKIYHDGNHNYIDSSNGYIYLRSAGGENMGIFEADGGVNLYYNNVKKFATYASGVIVYGSEGAGGYIDLYADEGDDDSDKWRFQATTGGDLNIQNYGGAAWDENIKCVANGGVKLYYDDSIKLQTVSDGVNCEGHLGFDDDSKIQLGTGDDYHIYFDGTRTHFNAVAGGTKWEINGTEHLELQTDGDYFVKAHIQAWIDDHFDLGRPGHRWDDVYATNTSITTSDRTKKNTIVDSDLGLSFVNKLKPVSYKFNDKTRTHYGLIAQDVETTLSDISKPTTDFAGFIKSTITRNEYTKEAYDTPKVEYGLRYSEFIAPLIKAVQELSAEVETLKTKVAALESS